MIPWNRVAVIVPTLNAASGWSRFVEALKAQGVPPSRVLIVDSSSDDATAELARREGFRLREIERSAFNHGGTRQWAADLESDAEVVVFLTQDAIPANSRSLQNLLSAFDDASVAAAFGRQLPHPGAGPIESHARLFNYPGQSGVRALKDRESLGFKAIFISNSFAAYRCSALRTVGGFPANTIFGEDTVVAARLLLAGGKIAYAAAAPVYHSHSYTWAEEFRRYFDIGVLHTRESWLLREFGQAGSEGRRFVRSEIRYLWPRNALLIPSALLRTAAKLAGYRLGRIEARLKPRLKRRLSMHGSYWLPRVDS
jgi:rhamnosyltransferase